MDLYKHLSELMEKRKSTRAFSQKKVPDEYIEKIKNLAFQSPYASGRKNWNILSITDSDTINKMARIINEKVLSLKDSIREGFRDGFIEYAENFVKFQSAPVVFVPVFKISPTMSIMIEDTPEYLVKWERENYVKSISCAAFLVHLSAESLNLGSCYMTGPLIAEEELKELLEIKKIMHIGAVIPVGYHEGEE